MKAGRSFLESRHAYAVSALCCLLLGPASTWAKNFQSDGFDAAYEVRVGDLDQDGDLDLLVKERAPVVMVPFDDLSIPIRMAPNVNSFALLQTTGGALTLQTNLTNLAVASTQPSSIEIISIDVDLDGNQDAVVKGIGSAIAGVKDQIVFASNASGKRNTPSGIKALDDSTKKFIAEFAGWAKNNNYFENTAIANGWYETHQGASFPAWWYADYLGFWGFQVNGQNLLQPNEDPYWRETVPQSCSSGLVPCRFLDGVWQMYVNATELTITYDYSHFDTRARSIASNLQTPVQDDELVAGSQNAVNVSTILRNVLGRSILGNVLETGGKLAYERNVPESLGKIRLASIQNMVIALQAAATQATTQPPPFKPVNSTAVNVDAKNRITTLERGAMTSVKAVVLHRTGSATLSSAIREAKTSRKGTHFYIDKDGTIYQVASLDQYTAHVGVLKSKCIDQPTTCTATELQDAQRISGTRNLSNYEQKKSYPKRYPHNADSVGIEVVATYDPATKTYEAPTGAQVEAVEVLVEALKTQYSLTSGDVYHHDLISYKEGLNEGGGLGY